MERAVERVTKRVRLWACLVATAVGVVAASVGPRVRSAAPTAPVSVSTEEASETAPSTIAAATPSPAPTLIGRAIGAEAFVTLPFSPAQRAALDAMERLDASGDGRVLAELLLSGYHHEALEGQMGASMTGFANERIAQLARQPERTMSLVRAAMQLPALAGADLAYGRASLLTVAERMPGQRAAAHELAREELTAPALPVLPTPSLGRPDGEPDPAAVAVAASLPLYTGVVAAHSTFLDTADGPAESVRGTVAAIRAQNDQSLRLRLARQLVDRQPGSRDQLVDTLRAAGIALELES